MDVSKHLPLSELPDGDHAAFADAYAPGDIFDVMRGPGAHLAEGTRRMIQTGYGRWLAFLRQAHPSALPMPPAGRISPERVRAFIEHLALEVRPTSLAFTSSSLLNAARLLAPDGNWEWLRSIRRRLHAQARPEDRFDRLVSGWQTLDLGIRLMDEALNLPHAGHRVRELQYRDGLILALLSCWPIRRRSISALTMSRHVEFIDGGLYILLHAADTKSKRSESFRVPDQLVPYFLRYLKELRPRLLRYQNHDGLWVSYRGRPLIEGRIYDIVRRETLKAFGKAMSLHDFRRAGATFLATVAPNQVGLIPGILQHASPEVNEKHYNLARSVEASRRFWAHLARMRGKLRPRIACKEG
jgi:integrase/recombinase XerD